MTKQHGLHIRFKFSRPSPAVGPVECLDPTERRGTHIVRCLTHTFKLQGKKSKAFNTPSINFRREEALLEFNLLHKGGDIRERSAQLL